MRTISTALLTLALIAGCGGGGGGGVGNADLTGGDDASPGPDTVVPGGDGGPEDWFKARDSAVPPPEGRLALRFEVRFGTTNEWKGLSLLAPSGHYHTEAAEAGACAGALSDSFLGQLEAAVDAGDPWSWGEAGRTGANCGSAALSYALHIEDLFEGISMDSDWCGPDEDSVAGRAEIIKKIQMLNAYVEQSGDCGVMPRLLGKPTAAAAAGLDDGTGTGFSVARFEDPDFCAVAYITYTGEVYRSNRTIALEKDTADAMAKAMAPVEGELNTLAQEICPEAAAYMFTPAVLEDHEQDAVVMIVGPGPDGWVPWLAAGGIATLVLPGQEDTQETIHLTDLSLFRVTDPGTPDGEVNVSAWEESILESTAYGFPVALE